MRYEVIEKEKKYLVGLEYYGSIFGEKDPIEKRIEDLWGRFSEFCKNKWEKIEEDIVNPELSYEVQIWEKEQLEEEGNMYVFVGMESEELQNFPIELSGKILPADKYANFTLEGKEIQTWEEDILQDWFPQSDYWMKSFDRYQFHVQCFHEERYKGVENIEDSELEVLIPVEEIDKEI
ncbi:MAG: GyrI-like domain-containing protein [Candidatus Thermoplasmatota archaeon]|nr:GyrI-like domain-containing protein [Candidatus Thermoplasmatota archaeon]